MEVLIINKFDEKDVELQVEAADCKEAIQKAADLLIQQGKITQQYVSEMLAVLDEYGPYFVLAPGMAFAHSRPSPSVKVTGLSMITLKEPVCFGSEKNDPVYLVCVIASRNNQEHLEMLKSIVTFLSDDANVQLIKNARSSEEKQQIIHALNQ